MGIVRKSVDIVAEKRERAYLASFGGYNVAIIHIVATEPIIAGTI